MSDDLNTHNLRPGDIVVKPCSGIWGHINCEITITDLVGYGTWFDSEVKYYNTVTKQYTEEFKPPFIYKYHHSAVNNWIENDSWTVIRLKAAEPLTIDEGLFDL